MKAGQVARSSSLGLAFAACFALAWVAQADQAIERPGSILLFPKVCLDDMRDTSIKIANTGNLTNNVRCFYLNGDTCAETDFEITLTRQQPTQWRISSGRRVNPTDGIGNQESGLDPGFIPPVPFGFCGALICVEVGPDGQPVAQNKLKGEADLLGTGTGLGVGEYNAIAVTGGTDPEDNDRNNDLELDDSEYAACPQYHWINFTPAPNGDDQVISALGNSGLCSGGENASAPCNNGSQCESGTCAGSPTFDITKATILPCNLDFNAGIPTDVTLSLQGWDELERAFSTTTPLSCWGSITLGEPLLQVLSNQHATVQIESTEGGPVVMVAESFHIDTENNIGVVTANVHKQDDGEDAVIRLLAHP
jgi:hypothetical protein